MLSVLELINEGLGVEAIIRDYYPDLTMKDVRACLQYAIDLVRSESIHIQISFVRPWESRAGAAR